MRVVLAGTGSAAGLPAPACGCARCRAASRTGDRRRPSSAVVDGVLTLGLGATSESLPGYDVTSLAGGRALDVRTPTGRLLWAAGGVDPAAVPADASYDVVALGAEGDVTAPAVGHTLARLRALGRVRPDTAVVAVGIGHQDPVAMELRRRLDAWGVQVVGDGATVEPLLAAPVGRRTLVLGGARSGKSAVAEQMLAAEPRVTYVATAGDRADDAEWAARIQSHRDRRPPGWATLETLDVGAALAGQGAAILVDCLSLWLAAVMAAAGVWAGDRGADDVVAKTVDGLVRSWLESTGRAVAVSSEVGSGVVPDTLSGRRFRDELGRLNQRIAAESDEVLLVVAGQILRIDAGP